MVVKQGRFYLRHNTLSEDIPIAIIFKVTQLLVWKKTTTVLYHKNEDGQQFSEGDVQKDLAGLRECKLFSPWEVIFIV